MSARTVTAAPLVLSPPEVLQPVLPEQSSAPVAIPPSLKAQVEQQLEDFVRDLLTGDAHSEGFKQRVDAAFRLGRKEIANATRLSSGFMRKNTTGIEDTEAFRAIGEMHELLDQLNPANEGDLLAPTTILGIALPFGNKLSRYFRKYHDAEKQIAALLAHVTEAQDEVARDVAAIETTRGELWQSLQKLEAAAHFIRALDARLSAKIDEIRGLDPERALTLEQEVLFYVRQNLQDILATQALTLNGYRVMEVLKKTGRDVINGCERVSTLGMAALATAVTLARATGNQIGAMKMLEGAATSLNRVLEETGGALTQHVDAVGKFASDPLFGIQALQSMFDKTFQAMETLDNYRTQALGVMQQNNQMLRAQLEQGSARI